MPAAVYDAYGRPYGGRAAMSLQRSDVGAPASGAPLVAGVFDWDEPPELSYGERRHETLRLMSQSDAYISEVVRANSLPLLSKAVWQVKPGVEAKPGVPPSPEQLRARQSSQLVEANLLGYDSGPYGRAFRMSSSWTQFLREALKMLEHGFSIFHKQDMAVAGRRVYRRLLWLEPASIWRWDIDGEDTLRGVWRMYRRPDGTYESNEYLPASELCLFVWELAGARLEGVPLIRSSFGPWKRKEFLLRCKMIAAQRASTGVPWAKRDATEDGDDPEATGKAIEDFLQSILGQGLEKGYLSTPNPTVELDFLKQDAADLEKFDNMTQDENLHIAHGGSTKAGMLGELPGGARATGDVQQAFAYVLVEAVGQVLADQMNNGVAGTRGVIQELHDWNHLAAVKTPCLEVTGVDPNEADRKLRQLKEMKGAGIVKDRPQLEQYALRLIGIDLPDEVFLASPMGTPPPAPAGPGPGFPAGGALPADRGAARPGQAPGQQGAPPQGPAQGGPAGEGDAGEGRPFPQGAEAARGRRQASLRMGVARAIARGRGMAQPERAGAWRQPTALERMCVDLGRIDVGVKQAEARMAGVVRRAWRRMADDLAARAKAGKIERGTVDGLRRSRPKGLGDLRGLVSAQFLSSAAVAREHVVQELARQAVLAREVREGKVKARDLRLALRRPGRLPAADWRESTLLGELGEEARVAAELVIDSLWNRLVEQAVARVTTETARHMTAEELAEDLEGFLAGLSEGQADDAAARAAHAAYAQGRDLEAKVAATRGEAGVVVRTEVLDDATCDACRALDFTVTGAEYEIGSEEYERDMPPAHCEGGDRCRGFYLVVAAPLESALDDAGEED